MSRFLIISNFVLFQIGWFACVLGGANQLAWAGSLVATLVLLIHVLKAPQKQPEINLLLIALVIGVVFESVIVTFQLAEYSSGSLLNGFAPHWMVLMWGLFASTLNVSMRWIKPMNLALVAVLGAVLAPLSYFAGYRLGAVNFPDLSVSLTVIALGWAVLLPLIVLAARRFDGYQPINNSAKKLQEK